MSIAAKKIAALVAGLVVFTVLASAVQAHPDHIGGQGIGNMFAHGLWHPLTGMDHLLVMLSVGIWSALTHSTLRSAMWLPVAFAMLLLVGAGLGLAGLTLPLIEPMIMASLLVLGLLIASRRPIPEWAGLIIVSFFALFHGLAHGMELPAGNGAIAFVAGFMLMTLALHGAGLAGGFKLKGRRWLTGGLGAGIATYGALLITGI